MIKAESEQRLFISSSKHEMFPIVKHLTSKSALQDSFYGSTAKPRLGLFLGDCCDKCGPHMQVFTINQNGKEKLRRV